MAKIVIKSAKTVAKGALKIGKELIGNEVIDKVVDVSATAIDKYNSRIRIPDLKDVPLEEALKNLKDIDLLPLQAIAQPNVAYADLYENVVVHSEPKFGKKVEPKTTVKIYYITNEVIILSKELEKRIDDVFKLPRVKGLDIYDAREDLEELGLRVSLKLEKPSIQHINREDGQVTRVTYPDNKRLSQKQKKGERVWLYYVDETVIQESVNIKNMKVQIKTERKEKIAQTVSKLPKPFKRKMTED